VGSNRRHSDANHLGLLVRIGHCRSGVHDMNIFGFLFPSWVKLALTAAAVASALGFYAWRVHVEREVGRKEVSDKQAVIDAKRTEDALQESINNARESLRRIEKQQENERVNTQRLADAKRDAALNAADAERLRAQQADSARRWVAATRDSPSGGVCTAAGDAIMVQADVRSRIDKRAGELATLVDTTHSAGLKCVADYNALKK
jgi:hypothetical protein